MPDMDAGYPLATAIAAGDRVLLRQTDTDTTTHTRKTILGALLQWILSSAGQSAAYGTAVFSPTIQGSNASAEAPGDGGGLFLAAGSCWVGAVGRATDGATLAFSGASPSLGGSVALSAGDASEDGTQAGNLFLGGGGYNGAAGAVGGLVQFASSYDVFNNSAGNIDIYTNPYSGAPASATGEVLLNDDPSLLCFTIDWRAADPNGRVVFTATRSMRITAIIGRPEANNGTAATLAPVKAASGTAVAAGTPLTSNSMDLHGGATDTNQTLALVTAACLLAAGDSVAIQTSGAPTGSAGTLTIWAAPR